MAEVSEAGALADMHETKKIIIIAGPNGAGKTTFATEFLAREAGCPDFINADVIAAALPEADRWDAALRAGGVMLDGIRRRAEAGESFAFETTLAGRTYARAIPRWRAMGYHVRLIYLSLPTADMAVARVAARVAQGGHDVPEGVIRRRFAAGVRNLRRLYQGVVTSWVLYDNSGPSPRWIAAGVNP